MTHVGESVQNKRILLCVSGGIAVYKAVALCSQLVKAGALVRVILTQSASKFVTPLTFQTISRHAVATDTFEENDPTVVSHIDWADWAQLVVVAPATANILGKMACGIADDMLSTTLLATQAPVMVAPAMNVHMLQHPAVQRNMEILRQRGVDLLEPGTGQLACGYIGKGRLPEPEQIFEAICRKFSQQGLLRNKRVLVTAGGTIERIDPVRYLSNDSSGKMGYAIAAAAVEQGAEVQLVSANVGISPPAGVELIKVESAEEMFEAVISCFDETDITIMAAAVADYRPVKQASSKMKKKDEKLVLELERTPDILAELGKRKNKQFVVGFAAETENLQHYAMDKLQRKRCDLIVANDITTAGGGFGSDQNEVSVFDQHGLVEQWPLSSKQSIAERLVELIFHRLAAEENA